MDDIGEIKAEAVRYFRNLFEAKQCNGRYSQMSLYFPHLTDRDISFLSSPVCDNNIKVSLFNIGGIKAPGPDGFPAIFFQKFWSACKADLIKMVSDCFVKGRVPNNIN